MSNVAWVSYNILQATYDQLKARTEFFAFPQVTHLAVRITSDTPGAVQCPNYDSEREIELVPDDPTCLGVGWIIPEVLGPDGVTVLTPAQRGYLNPVYFDVVLVPGEMREEQQEEGVVQYPDQTIAYWPPRQILPKKGDVFIVTLPTNPSVLTYYQHDLRSYRYVIADIETPSVLGSQTLLYRATLEPRRADNVIYAIPTADTTGLFPGTWT